MLILVRPVYIAQLLKLVLPAYVLRLGYKSIALPDTVTKLDGDDTKVRCRYKINDSG